MSDWSLINTPQRSYADGLAPKADPANAAVARPGESTSKPDSHVEPAASTTETVGEQTQRSEGLGAPAVDPSKVRESRAYKIALRSYPAARTSSNDVDFMSKQLLSNKNTGSNAAARDGILPGYENLNLPFDRPWTQEEAGRALDLMRSQSKSGGDETVKRPITQEFLTRALANTGAPTMAKEPVGNDANIFTDLKPLLNRQNDAQA